MPPAWVRLAALDTLLGTDDDRAQHNWRAIANRAEDVAAWEYFSGSTDLHGRFLDLPLFYLEGQPEDVLQRVERQRRAGMAFSLLLTARFTDHPDTVRELVNEEAALVDEIRALRLLIRLPTLPERLQFHWQTRGDVNSPAADWRDLDAARVRLVAHRSRLQELSRLESAAPECSRQRVAGATIEEFSRALQF